ncbi:MAG: FecR family protein [Treponema sp.]|jgi:ferric-dicitrate binding protein FerR (iron transport regulator)|nr:FecR family protein [Treponema sp.]
MKKTAGIILFLTLAWRVFAQNTEARLVELSGTVEVKETDASAWRAAVPNEVIGKNTVISTGIKSTAVIVLGGSRLSVRPLTRLSLEELRQREGGEEVSLYLRSGRVRAEVSPPAGGRTDFTVRSPSATASVRGTAFEFDTRHLRVDSGTVRLSNNRGQRVYVAGGQISHIDESEQRVVPPFEAANGLLTPALPELAGTGGDGGSRAPNIPESVVPSPQANIYVEWQ